MLARLTSPRVRGAVGVAGLLVLLAVLAVEAAAPLDNNDTYFHLRFGHEFLTGAWSLGDPGSVSALATADWVPTQWLSQLAMAQVEQWFGLAGVAWLCGLLFLGLASALYLACRRYAEPLVAAGTTAVALVACSTGLSMRPQLVSYLLVVVTTAWWCRARDTGRVPWLLVPLTWLWSMCHGMYPVGVVIGLVAVLGLVLDRELPRRTLARCAGVPVLSAVFTLLTPVGPGLFSAVLRVDGRAQYFYEWAPPDFTRPLTLTVVGLLALAMVPRLRRPEPTPWFDLGLLGLAALWALYSQRSVPVAACLVAPLVAVALQPWFGVRQAVRPAERGLVLGGCVAVLAALALVVPHTADAPRAEPRWLDEALRDQPAGTIVLDEQAFGGYLMWRYPQLDPFPHGYGDAYTDAELERNADLAGARAGWLDTLSTVRPTLAVLRPGSPLAYNLREVQHWEVLEVSDELELLRAPREP